MLLVTGYALSHQVAFHGRLVRALLEIIGCPAMTLTANVLHLGYPRWQSSVIPMTAGTGGSAPVVFLQKIYPVNTLFVLLIRVGGEMIFIHQFPVGMAVRTGSWDIGGKNLALRIVRLEYLMSSVTIGAGGGIKIVLV
jgi:hypothetical protein